MDINNQLNEIILKYNLDKYYPQFRRNIEAEILIRKLVASWDCLMRIVCIVTDETDKLHFKKFIPEKMKVKFLSCSQKEFYGHSFNEAYNCSQLEGVEWNEVDRVYIISFQGEAFVSHWLRKHRINHIYLYDYFLGNGLFLENEYDRFVMDRSMQYFAEFASDEGRQEFITFELFNQQQKYNNSFNTDMRSVYVKKIFFLSLYIKNFSLAKEMVIELKKNCCFDEDYSKAWNEIENLLIDIRKKFAGRKQKDIIMIWLDQLAYDAAEGLPFLNKMMNTGNCFDNMFTVTPFTNPTLKTLFCSKRAVDDMSYRIDKIDQTNSEIFLSLSEKGYAFKAISGCWQQFYQKNETDLYHPLFGTGSEVLWDTLRNILLSEAPLFVLSHILTEEHFPWLSTRMTDEIIEDADKRAWTGALEADYLLEYYMGYIGRNTTRIFMSDHGLSDFNTRFHVIMVIVGESYLPCRIQTLQSYIDFQEIVKKILNNINLCKNIVEKQYVEIQDLDYYSGKKIAAVLKAKEAIDLWMFGYRGLITKKYIYISFNNGTEWLAQRDGKAVRPSIFGQLEDFAETPLIEKFRAIIKEKNSDSIDEKKLRYSRYLYKIYQRALPYNLEKRTKLCQLFHSFKDQSVALRMGGTHTEGLYMMLDIEARKKVACIIDQNPQCFCQNLGKSVISLEESINKSIDVIILSSYKYLDELKKEAKTYPPHILVIDLYDWLKKQGVYCKKELHLIEVKDEDYEVDFPFDEVN